MFKQVFDWLLNKGVAGATAVINLIFYMVLAAIMTILNWYHKNH